MGEKDLLPYRKKMQSVFQDPYSSLDPSHTVQDIICEPMEIHKMYTPKEQKDRAKELIRVVGLKEQDLLKYPHEFSGGQRQRISIARALSVQPEFVVCDEPISALDVSLQAQIVQMLQDLQEKYGLTYLFISHQLQVVQKICDEIGVLYLGNLMEIADADKLYSNPLHPYTKMLISSIPVPDPRVKTLDQSLQIQVFSQGLSADAGSITAVRGVRNGAKWRRHIFGRWNQGIWWHVINMRKEKKKVEQTYIR